MSRGLIERLRARRARAPHPTNPFAYVEGLDALSIEAADRIAALEAEASEGERLREAIREALDCFKAAEAEGMADRVAEAREADGYDPAPVAGLFERRVAFAIPALDRALTPEAPAREGA